MPVLRYENLVAHHTRESHWQLLQNLSRGQGESLSGIE